MENQRDPEYAADGAIGECRVMNNEVTPLRHSSPLLVLSVGLCAASPTTMHTRIRCLFVTHFLKSQYIELNNSIYPHYNKPLWKIHIMNQDLCAKQYAEFITITCLDWIPILEDERFKDIIMQSLSFLSEKRKITVYSFVPIAIGMSNHLHLVWQILGDNTREDVQRDFLKYTEQQILKILQREKSSLLDKIVVHAKDRKYQIWERNSLSIPIWSDKVIRQKVEYIHYNPVRAGLCKFPEDYKYSSAGFYYKQDRYWSFLVHCDGWRFFMLLN
jgi:putative transposase